MAIFFQNQKKSARHVEDGIPRPCEKREGLLGRTRAVRPRHRQAIFLQGDQKEEAPLGLFVIILVVGFYGNRS
jgi:hypothetical protein